MHAVTHSLSQHACSAMHMHVFDYTPLHHAVHGDSLSVPACMQCNAHACVWLYYCIMQWWLTLCPMHAVQCTCMCLTILHACIMQWWLTLCPMHASMRPSTASRAEIVPFCSWLYRHCETGTIKREEERVSQHTHTHWQRHTLYIYI